MAEVIPMPEIVSLTRAPRAALRVPEKQIDYYPQIPDCTEVAGRKVDPEKKCVRMSAADAEYWIDQGVLGESAGEHHAGAALGEKKE